MASKDRLSLSRMGNAIKRGVKDVVHKLPFDRRVEEAHKQGFFGSMTLEQIQQAEKDKAKPPEVKDNFPDMSKIPAEKVLKRWYNWDLKQWETTAIQCKIMPKMFAEGALRAAHYMTVIHPDGREEKCVAKWQKDKRDQVAEIYDTDVIMQAACQAVAKAFNARKPAKLVQFVDCYVVQRADQTWWGVETYIPGKYVKHNNNWGYIEKGARNTPQAFSHFSYEFTEGKMMIVDIQGVGDIYTDPQIHTCDGKGYGCGNMGEKGMEQFMKTHWCNSICQYLGLEFHAPKKGGIYHQPNREGTCAVGRMDSNVEAMKVSDFIGNLRPVRGSASPEDLAMLGIKPQQFDELVNAFNKYDKDRSGFLDKGELFHLFQEANVPGSRTKQTEEFLEFTGRIQKHMGTQGQISFKWFVLAWTDNE